MHDGGDPWGDGLLAELVDAITAVDEFHRSLTSHDDRH